MESNTYDLKSVKLPRLSGLALRFLVKMLEGPFKALLTDKLFKDAGVTAFRQLEIEEVPTYFPLHNIPEEAQNWPEIKISDAEEIIEYSNFELPWPTVKDFAKAYQNRTTTPVLVAEKVLAAVEKSNSTTPPLRAIIATNSDDLQQQAEASLKRFKNGKPLSILDGVPVAVKDELNLRGYPTKVGTKFLGTQNALGDATIIKRLRDAGALLIGKTNMHEIGIGVTGLNPHQGTPRNPYNPNHFTGGSSSGSASAVAAGLCPLAVGADGGGSIRIPSSFCGLVGLKSTFGRISEHGVATLVWSVAHNGVLANNAIDSAVAYSVIAGPDPHGEWTLKQPKPTLSDFKNRALKGLRLGIFREWFNHADPACVEQCQNLLIEFEKIGAEIVEVKISGLEAGRVAHLITIASEMSQALEKYHPANHTDYGLDVRLNLALARQFTARDLLHSQRTRTLLLKQFNRALQLADVLITPSTGIPAPQINEKALTFGESDLTTATEIMRFAAPANLTGLPAISFPAGYTKNGLPIGMQAIGRAWEEHLLLRLAFISENFVEKLQPRVLFSILAE